MTERVDPPPALALLGEEIRLAREDSGLTQAQLAEKIHNAPTLISMVETARRRPTPEVMERIERALGTKGRLTRLWKLAKDGRPRARVGEFFELERQATAIRTYNPMLVPGLLQSEDYARSLLRRGRYIGNTEEAIESYVAIRLRRQETLALSRPPSYWAVIDESVLHRTVGGAGVMRQQLAELLRRTSVRNVNFQVMPFTSEGYPVLAPMTLLNVHGTTVGYIENAESGRLVSNPDDVSEFVDRFELLRAWAASIPESERMIETRMEEL